MQNFYHYILTLTLGIVSCGLLFFFFPIIGAYIFLLFSIVTILCSYYGGYKQGFITLAMLGVLLFSVSGKYEEDYFDMRYIRFVGMMAIAMFAVDRAKKAKWKIQTQAEEIKSKRSNLRVLSESITDALITTDENSKILWCNSSVSKIFGWECSELKGNSITMLMPERIREAHTKGMMRYINSGVKKLNWNSTETIGLRKNGKEFPIEISFGEYYEEGIRKFSGVLRDISVRKEYEDKLKESEARFRELADSAPMFIWIAGVDKANDWFNKGWYEYTGRSPEQDLGRGWEDLIHPEDLDRVVEDYENAFDTLKPFNLEFRLRRYDGKYSWFFSKGIPLFSISNEFKGYIGSSIDITERKISEHALMESEQRFRLVTESVQDHAIISLDKNGVVKTWNIGAEKVYGWKSDEVIGRTATFLFPLDTIEPEKKLLSQMNIALEKGKFEAEEERIKKDGSMLFVSIVITPLFDELGQLQWFGKVDRDISERKAYEISLRQSEERYKAFIANSTEAIWRIELDEPCPIDISPELQSKWFYEHSYFAESNSSSDDIYNPNKGSIVGIYYKDLKPYDDRTLEFHKKFISSNYLLENQEGENFIDGENRYFSTTIIGVVENNYLVRFWGLHRDVTKPKKYLAEMEKAKLTAELANREKDRFLASLSHELRTPLVSVLGYANMLKLNLLDEKDKNDAINTIQKNAQLQVDLIEDLLDLSRIVSGKVSINMETFNVKESIENAIHTIKHQAIDKGLNIVEELEDIKIYADPKRFSQIILNLLSNAVKFTDKGFIKVVAHRQGSSLVVKVTDTGIGIKAENIGKIFKQFAQVDDGLTKKYGGLGLGLSIVKQLVEAHNGKVSATSSYGEGSTFVVELPIINNEDFDDKPIITNISFEGCKVLITEDVVDTASYLKLFFELHDAQVVVTYSAKGAREAISKDKFDIYIFDISMPEENGYSLISSLRKLGDETPAVALTAFSNAEYEIDAYRFGFTKYLRKPATSEELLQIRTLINK